LTGPIDESQAMPATIPSTVTVDVVESKPIGDRPRSHRIPDPADAMLLNYDPEAIADYYVDRPTQVLFRCIGILVPILNLILGLRLDQWFKRGPRQQRRRAIQFRDMLTNLGPAFIKIGQALSTRPDLLTAIYMEEMSQLQDQIPAFSTDIAFQFIEEELGATPYEIYAELSPDPISAASLGQVYKGRLHSGEKVAVKVQRPGLAEGITLDIYIVRGIASWVMNRWASKVKSDLVGIIDEFGQQIFAEMDYTQEGHNAERFESLYGKMKDIYVPKIYWEQTGRRVLTMEWIDGLKLTKMAEIQAQGTDPTYLVELGVQCSLRQLLEHGFFHADPHPGNLLAMPDGRLAYLDFGMMSEIEPYQRYGLIEAVVHLVNRDFEALAQDYIKLDFLKPDTDLTPIIPALGVVFNSALGNSVAELNFKNMTDELSSLMFEYPFSVPAYYALIIRSLVTLEGIAINVDPEFKVLSKAYPYISKRLLTDPAPELRASLRDLLFKDGSFRWNRLENLLSNAQDSEEYDVQAVLDQTLEFLFSERGEFIRERLVSELVEGLDSLGRNTLDRFTFEVRQRMGLPVSAGTEGGNDSLDRFQRVLTILRETQGFDPMKILPLVPQLLAKRELQTMGQQVATGLAQRTLARLIRELLTEKKPQASLPGRVASRAPQPVPERQLQRR
jgi:predicted unusual protein kinase regulating ubiquinone biosynthesis (AarF/ABC1/UbiB family)